MRYFHFVPYDIVTIMLEAHYRVYSDDLFFILKKYILSQ